MGCDERKKKLPANTFLCRTSATIESTGAIYYEPDAADDFDDDDPDDDLTI